MIGVKLKRRSNLCCTWESAEVQEQLTLANHTVPANTAALNDPDVQTIYEVARFGESLHQGTPMANHSYGGCQWGPVGEATVGNLEWSSNPAGGDEYRPGSNRSLYCSTVTIPATGTAPPAHHWHFWVDEGIHPAILGDLWLIIDQLNSTQILAGLINRWRSVTSRHR